MKSVKGGDKVQILYEAKLDSGEFCYKNDAENLTEIVIGEGKFFPVIEKVLCTMAEGESKVVTLEAEDAFGPHLDNLVIKVPKSVFKTDTTLEIGSRVKIDAPTGNSYVGGVKVLGPAPAPMERRAGRYRAQALLHAATHGSLQKLMRTWVPMLEELPLGRRVRWSIDVDAIELV